MTVVQAQKPIQVTANSGALSGLDKGVVQAGKGSTPKLGKAPGSRTANGNPKPQIATNHQLESSRFRLFCRRGLTVFAIDEGFESPTSRSQYRATLRTEAKQ